MLDKQTKDIIEREVSLHPKEDQKWVRKKLKKLLDVRELSKVDKKMRFNSKPFSKIIPLK